jgi:hypothetical protein
VTVIAGQHAGRCLLCTPARPRMAAVQADLAHRFATLGLIPHQIQTDRHPCFLGAEDSAHAALPSRFTLWLAGLGIGHRLIPVRRPQRNGAVERFHGGVERGWRGEAGGLEAFIAVWNAECPPLSRRHRRYRGRTGFRLGRVWALLAHTQVTRQVSRQGRVSLWDRNRSVGMAAAGQTVTVRFDPVARCAVVRDAYERLLREVPLPWLTQDWLWAPIPLTDQQTDAPDRSTVT